MYRPPNNDPGPLKALAMELEKLTSSGALPTIILSGDFNLPSIDWKSESVASSPRYGREINDLMMQICHDNWLHQLVDNPTHGNNILDLILTTVPDSIENVTHRPGLSKHDAITADCYTQR